MTDSSVSDYEHGCRLFIFSSPFPWWMDSLPGFPFPLSPLCTCCNSPTHLCVPWLGTSQGCSCFYCRRVKGMKPGWGTSQHHVMESLLEAVVCFPSGSVCCQRWLLLAKSGFRQKVFDNLHFLACLPYIASLFQVLDKRQNHKYPGEVSLYVYSLVMLLLTTCCLETSTGLEEALG